MIYYFNASPNQVIDAGKLLTEIVAAGIPIDPDGGLRGPDANGQLTITTTRDLTQAEQDTLAGVIAAHDARPRRPRKMLDIVTDLNALSAAQQSTVWTQITSGSPPVWSTDTGTEQGALSAHQLLGANSTGALQQQARLRMVALFMRDNSKWLMNPPWLPGVSIAGDEPYTVAVPTPQPT